MLLEMKQLFTINHHHLCFAALLLVGCTPSTGADLSDWSAGFERDTDTGLPSTQEGIGFSIVIPYDVPYDTRLSSSGSTEACSVDVPDSPETFEGIECTLDINELDLYGSGLTFEVYVPPGSCEYLIYSFYTYEAWESGVGPSTVSYTVNTDGSITDEKNIFDGDPYCEYNYTLFDPDHPNCCIGSYTLIENNLLSGSVTEVPKSWDGELSQCYDGAAYAYDGTVSDSSGFPMDTIEPLFGSSFNTRFVWGSVNDRYATNVVFSNYYEPADHDGGPPAGLTGEYSQPFYSFRCYDAAEELKSKIDLVVREWNEVSEFDAEGDPQTTGVETASGEPIDDLRDWAIATPGGDTYIGFSD
jgi:hypothetical protein